MFSLSERVDSNQPGHIFMYLKFLGLVCLVFPSAGLSDLLTDTALSFGKIAIRDNDSVSAVHLPRSGNQFPTNKILIIEPGTPGAYTLTGLPPFVEASLSADVPAFSAVPVAGTEQFTISAVDIPSTIKADASGNAHFKVGGVLETSGNGGTYLGPLDYQIMLNINLVF
ncbi:hypothetical protein GCM10011357_08970 [Lacimicrobium alkaliphilum]|uniref:DUF4402 domain-containing protein n=2 Tax=Lacimicrobium alkaliphilum TaxID=1526571 RepID=A0ABQ1R319_9ALTE|nr:hypothetical protein GCM10011357_08970 [Lacimicrobium alkaliphilum]